MTLEVTQENDDGSVEGQVLVWYHDDDKEGSFGTVCDKTFVDYEETGFGTG